MNFSEHGGGCCGVTHLLNMDTLERSFRADLAHKLTSFNEAYPTGRALEVVLNRDQRGRHRDELLNQGFVEVYAFHNSNSGNACFVYYYSRAQRAIVPEGDVYTVNAIEAPPTPPVAPPVVVYTSLAPVFVDGRVGGVRVTLEDIRRDFPRCRLYRQITVMSNGGVISQDGEL